MSLKMEKTAVQLKVHSPKHFMVSFEKECGLSLFFRKWEWGEVNWGVRVKGGWLRDGTMAWSCQRGGNIIDTR